MRIYIILRLALFLTACVSRAATTPDGLVYSATATAVTITGYSGTGGVVSIPAMIGGVSVTSIADNAFTGAASGRITSLSIPETVRTLGSSAIVCGVNLVRITVDSRNPYFSASPDGVSLFNRDKTTLLAVVQGYRGPAYSVEEGVVSIGDDAFASCGLLQSIFIPASLKNLGSNQDGEVFSDCTSLQSFTVSASSSTFATIDGVLTDRGQTKIVACPQAKAIRYIVPQVVTAIGPASFKKNKNITEIQFHGRISEVQEAAFMYCDRLIKAELVEGLVSVGRDAFRASSVASWTIPSTLISIGAWAFISQRTAEFLVHPQNLNFSSESGVLFSKDKTTLIQFPEAKAKSYIIPSTVKTLGNSSFFSSGLLSLYVPRSVETINVYAFEFSDLSAIIFEGPPPLISPPDPRASDLKARLATMYYVQSNGWGSTYGGRPTAPYVAPALSNLSVRAALAADQALIVGAVVGSGKKDILLRVGGPALRQFGLQGMNDPRLDVFGVSGALLGGNNDWQASLQTTFASVGAFPFPSGSKDSALVQNLGGSFTAQARGDGAGIVLVEAYDVAGGYTPRLINLSSRNSVGSGSDILIAGFALNGVGPKRLLIRAVGSELEKFGVDGALRDPILRVTDSRGDVVATNDNWDASLATVFSSVGAFPLTVGSRDAAVLVTLTAGASYTAQVSGVGNTTGEALVEVYEVPF